MTSWLVYSSPDRTVLTQTLAGDIVLCSWVRHFTQSLCLFLRRDINQGTREHIAEGSPVMD